MVEKLKTVLLEKQDNLITPQTVLTAHDFVDCIEAVRLDADPDAEMDDRGSAGYDSYPPIIGRTNVELGIKMGLYSLGTTNSSPDIVKLFECSGWKKRLDVPNIELVPVSEIVNAATLWGYRGGPGANKAILEKYGNVMFDGTLSLEHGKRCEVDFTGRGKLVSLPGVATMPSINTFRERVVVPTYKAATTMFMGVTDYKLVKFELPFGQDIQNLDDPTDTFGGGETEMADRKISWSATVYLRPTATLIPQIKLHAGTSGAISIQWGSVYGSPDLRIYAPNAYLSSVKEGNRNGILTWECKGTFLANDVAIRIYNNTSSSYSSTSISQSSDSDSSSSDSSSQSSSSSSNSSSSTSTSSSSTSVSV